MPAVSTHDSRRATQVKPRVVVLLSGVLTIVFLISFFFSDRGIAELQHARTRVSDLRSNIKRLETDNARLRAVIGSVALLVAFLVIEIRTPEPLMPLRIFRIRTLAGSNIVALLLGAVVF